LSNLVSHNLEAKLLDIGYSTFTLLNEIRKLGQNNWRIIGMDIVNEISSRELSVILMDEKKMGFRDETFEQALCLFTLEHIGLDNLGLYNLGCDDSDYGVRWDNLQ
jgi:hypothetical protein